MITNQTDLRTAAALPLYLDCDTGVDDALTLAYLAARDGVDLRGVGTVSGNIDAATAARNTLDLLTLLDRGDVPVAIGARDPLCGSYGGGAPHVHGSNGVGGIELPRTHKEPLAISAAQLLIRLAHQNPGRLRVLAIGPLTNLALALRLEPNLPSLVAEVTVMGGAALVPGNVTPVAEANIHNDAEAAAEVFAADWPILLAPLDVTMDHLLTERERQQLLAIDHPAAQYLGAMLKPYSEFYTDILGEPACAMHDPLAAALAVGGVQIRCAPTVAVSVDTSGGLSRGQTVCDLRGRFVGYPEQRGAHCRVVLSLAEDFCPHLISTLQRLAPTAPRQPWPLTVVGSLNLDVTAVGTRLPTGGETVGGAVLHRQPGGKGANQAAAAARLAGASRFIGAVGRDAETTEVLAELKTAGVDTTWVQQLDEPTGTALIAVDAAGENQIVVCPGANSHLDLAEVEFAEDETLLCPLEIGLPLVEEAARRHRGYFALNAAPAEALPDSLIARCDLIIVNETEYAAIPELADAKLVAVTYGGKGSALYRHGELVARAPGRKVAVVNTVGAGDAFCAALVLALRSGYDPAVALAAANAVGADAVGSTAAQPPLARIESYVASASARPSLLSHHERQSRRALVNS